MAVLTQDYSSQKEFRKSQADFDLREHGSLRIQRKDIFIDDIEIVKPSYLKKFAHILKELRKLDKGRKVTLHCIRVFPEGIAGIFFKGMRFGKCKIVTYAHGEEILVSHTSKQLHFLGKLTLKFSDLVIANSKSTRDLVMSLYPQAKTEIIHPGVDISAFKIPEDARVAFRKAWGWTDDTIILTTVARMEARKNHGSVIRALAELRNQDLKLGYVIAGEGEERNRLGTMAKELGVSQWVKFMGRVSDEDKILIFSSVDIHIMPSVQLGPMTEGFGIVFLESAAAGLPSIAGNVGGQPEAVKDGKTGIIVDGTDLNQIKDAIQRLASNPDLCRSMGEAGKRWAEENDWEIATKRIYHAVQVLGLCRRPQ